MSAGTYNFTIEQGVTFTRLFTIYKKGGVKKGISYDLFGKKIAPIVKLTVGANSVTRDTGSWIDEGFTVGAWVTTQNFPVSANNGHFQVSGVSATILTLNTTLTTEVSVVGASVRRPRDLTGCTGAAMLRKTPSAATPAATFTVTFDATRTTGKVAVSLSKAQTSAIPCGDTVDLAESKYGWDLELTDSLDNTERVLEGDEILVSAERTR